MLPYYTLKNVSEGKFYVICFLAPLKKKAKKNLSLGPSGYVTLTLNKSTNFLEPQFPHL